MPASFSGPGRVSDAAPLASLGVPCFNLSMSERDDFITALVEDTVDGYEKVLSAASMKQMRAALYDAFAAHPAFVALIDENLPRAVPDASEERALGDAASAAAKEAAKKHG